MYSRWSCFLYGAVCSELSRVWSALTLLGSYNSKAVLYTVVQVSAHNGTLNTAALAYCSYPTYLTATQSAMPTAAR